jgi:hypothetical protein
MPPIGRLDDDGDRYLRLSDLVRYSTLSIRTLRRYMHDARDPLPVHRIGGCLLVKRSEFDGWLRRREQPTADRGPAPAPGLARAQLLERVARAVKATRG